MVPVRYVNDHGWCHLQAFDDATCVPVRGSGGSIVPRRNLSERQDHQFVREAVARRFRDSKAREPKGAVVSARWSRILLARVYVKAACQLACAKCVSCLTMRFLFPVENHMLNLNAILNGSVDMYTLDHRGTGRSNFLECQAAQAFTQGSPEGVGIDYVEIPNCIQDILFQIDNHTEAFSVTSAAKDVEFLISNLHRSDADVFVLGSSYGTYWAERVMHLAPAQVKGYILNGAVNEKTATFADWNANRLLPGTTCSCFPPLRASWGYLLYGTAFLLTTLLLLRRGALHYAVRERRVL